MPSAERDLFPRYLGSRKMRRFINDNFCDSVVEMNEEEEEYQVRELKGASFTNPAVLMMISADAPSDTEAKPRRRQACFMPFGYAGWWVGGWWVGGLVGWWVDG